MEKTISKLNCTTVFQNEYKAEIKLLSDTIYKNLFILGYISKPTDDFKNILAQDMFIKSNVKAFPYVMHFLFNLLDPQEFKKRFYWPISDKNSESNFRTSTITYLNYLNNKYNLGLENLKTHIVVLPGGTKFMKILLEITRLVMREQIKKYTKINPPENQIITKAKLDAIENNYRIFASAINDQQKKLDKSTVEIQLANQQLVSSIENIFIGSSICVANILNDTFLNDWHRHIQQTIHNEIIPPLNKIKEFNKQTKLLCTQITKIFEHKQFIKYDKDEYKTSIEYLKELFPEHESTIANIIDVKSNQININNLFDVIEFILPHIGDIITNFKYRDYDALIYEGKCIDDMLKKSTKIETKCMQLEKTLGQLKISINNMSNTESLLSSASLSGHDQQQRPLLTGNLNFEEKLVFTPPIKLNNLNIKKIPLCLPLLDEPFNNMKLFLNQQQPSIKKQYQQSKENSLINSNNSCNKLLKNIIDPIKLLNTMARQSKRKPLFNLTTCPKVNFNQSSLASPSSDENLKYNLNLQRRQLSYNTNTCTNTKTVNNNYVPKTPISPNSDVLLQKDIVNENVETPTHRHVQQSDKYTNIECNVNISPSGQLKSLLTYQNIPKLNLINDACAVDIQNGGDVNELMESKQCVPIRISSGYNN